MVNTSPTGARRAGWSAEAAAAPAAAMGAAGPTRPAFVGSTYREAASVGRRRAVAVAMKPVSQLAHGTETRGLQAHKRRSQQGPRVRKQGTRAKVGVSEEPRASTPRLGILAAGSLSGTDP